jgi:sarcosine oxidase subunit beta
VTLPVTPVRRQIVFTEPIAGLPAELPMTIDFASSFYFHREGPGLLMGMSYADQEPGFSTDQTDDWLPDLQAAVQRVAPAVSGAGIKGGWGGLYEVSPDHNALVGRDGDFVYATGFSGHGFLQAPAVGEVVRDLVLGRAPFVDVSAFGVDRFDAGRERPERNVV